MEFDRIYAEVDLGRIEENMEAMKEHLRPGTKMYGVVKTDAYGHGAVPVARTIDRFVEPPHLFLRYGYLITDVPENFLQNPGFPAAPRHCLFFHVIW